LTGGNDVAAVHFSAVRAYIGSPPRREVPTSRVSTKLGFNKSEDYSLKLDPVKQTLIDTLANRDLVMMTDKIRIPRPNSQMKKSL
jgi:hypothetical protein